MAFTTFLIKVRIFDRIPTFCSRRASLWRARFLDCREFANGWTPGLRIKKARNYAG
jgi:hypothetical protein